MPNTIQDHVEDLAGSISDTDALTQYLQNGAWDIIRRISMISPNSLYRFTTTQECESGIFSPIFGDIFDVSSAGANARVPFLNVRNDSGITCRRVPVQKKAQVNDSDSLYTATSSDPVYYVQNGIIVIVPECTGEVDAITIDTDNLTYDGNLSNVDYFPNDMKQMILYFAAMQIVSDKIRNYSIGVSATVEDLDLSGIAPPDNISSVVLSIPDITSISIEDLDTAPTYTKPTISLSPIPVFAPINISATIGAAPSASITSSGIESVSIGSLGTAPIYTEPEMSIDISQFETFLETDEDSELAQIQLGRLNNEIQQYQADIQNELNKFNEGVAEYKATAQKALEQAKIDASEAKNEGQLTLQAEIQDYQTDIRAYLADVNAYQAQVSKEIQEWQNESKMELDAWRVERESDLQEYSQNIKNEQNEFTKENTEYQADLKKKLQQAQIDLEEAVTEENLALKQEIEDFMGNLKKYQAEINRYAQRVGTSVKEWQSNFEKHTLSVKNLESTYKKLYQKYEQGFIPFKQGG